MKVFYVSWNDLETVFHEMPWKKNFTVYPSLYVVFITLTECYNYNLKRKKVYWVKLSIKLLKLKKV